MYTNNIINIFNILFHALLLSSLIQIKIIDYQIPFQNGFTLNNKILCSSPTNCFNKMCDLNNIYLEPNSNYTCALNIFLHDKNAIQEIQDSFVLVEILSITIELGTLFVLGICKSFYGDYGNKMRRLLLAIWLSNEIILVTTRVLFVIKNNVTDYMFILHGILFSIQLVEIICNVYHFRRESKRIKLESNQEALLNY